MKVLMTADTVGGVWNYAVDLINMLNAYGIETILATMGSKLSQHQRYQIADIPGLQLFESAYKLEWMQHPWEDVYSAGKWLLDIERRTRPDLIHLNNYAHGSLPWRAPVLVVGHSCVYSWFAAVHGSLPPDEWQKYHFMVQAGIQSADAVVAPTYAMLTALQCHYGKLPPLQKAIPNGRSADLFMPRAKEPFIFAAGRLWDEAKNLAALEAVALHLPWRIYVAGETTHPDGGEIQPQVSCLGVLSSLDTAEWMGRASIYALPARYEPFGLSVLEAALSGCALVLGDIPSLRENWEGAAVFIPPHDREALYNALCHLSQHPRERHKLGSAARHRAQRFTMQRTTELYIQMYQEVLEIEKNAQGIRHKAS